MADFYKQTPSEYGFSQQDLIDVIAAYNRGDTVYQRSGDSKGRENITPLIARAAASGSLTPESLSQDLAANQGGNSLFDSVSTGVKTWALPAAAILAGGAGLSALAGGGAAAGAGAAGTAGWGAGVTPEMAAWGLGESVPTAGGFLGAGGAAAGGLTAAELASAMEMPSGTTTTVGGSVPYAGGAGGTAGASNFLTDITGLGGNTLGSLVSGGASILSGEIGASAAKDALGETQRQFNINQANMQPWLTAGTKALGAQQDLMGLGASGPEAELSSLMSSPGYQFRKTQGEKSLAASSAARGGMGSGKALTGAMQYGQEFASNEYGNRLNQLAGLSGTGQTQANSLATLGQNYASEAGNASLAASQARQSGIFGAGQALSDYLNPMPKQKTLADLLAGR